MRVVSSVLPLAALAATLTLTACAPMTRVVMLPESGHDSVVEITPRTKVSDPAATAPVALTTFLTHPYQAAAVNNGKDSVSVQQWDAARVKSRYRELLAAQPPATHSYLLYFRLNETRLTPESAGLLDDAITQAVARPGNEIVVTGYTDSLGTIQANDRLSLERAEVIRAAIIARGFDPARVYAVGRGARNPLVPARDQEAQQRNRRVEITVR
jgi:outer membrane protein OmpA-like peptidoglycan-associated protein